MNPRQRSGGEPGDRRSGVSPRSSAAAPRPTTRSVSTSSPRWAATSWPWPGSSRAPTSSTSAAAAARSCSPPPGTSVRPVGSTGIDLAAGDGRAHCGRGPRTGAWPTSASRSGTPSTPTCPTARWTPCWPGWSLYFLPESRAPPLESLRPAARARRAVLAFTTFAGARRSTSRQPWRAAAAFVPGGGPERGRSRRVLSVRSRASPTCSPPAASRCRTPSDRDVCQPLHRFRPRAGLGVVARRAGHPRPRAGIRPGRGRRGREGRPSRPRAPRTAATRSPPGPVHDRRPARPRRLGAMADCLFCRIVAGDIPATKLYEDAHTVAFADSNPQAPTHILVVPTQAPARHRRAGRGRRGRGRPARRHRGRGPAGGPDRLPHGLQHRRRRRARASSTSTPTCWPDGRWAGRPGDLHRPMSRRCAGTVETTTAADQKARLDRTIRSHPQLGSRHHHPRRAR